MHGGSERAAALTVSRLTSAWRIGNQEILGGEEPETLVEHARGVSCDQKMSVTPRECIRIHVEVGGFIAQ